MAIEVKEKMKSGFSYTYSRDTATASVVYTCVGTNNELAVWNGVTVATHAAGIPDVGDTLVIDGNTCLLYTSPSPRDRS